MTTTTGTGAPKARWAGLLLAALAAVLAMLLPAGTASASGLPAAETRVGAISPTVMHIVGVAEHIAAGQHLGRAPSQLRLVAGHCVAAEAGDAAVTTGLRDAADSCLTKSFTADTPVLMADGKEEPIADVKVGDKVLATDPETGKTEARPVVALIRHSGKHTMVDLTLSDGSKIITTDHHPFWDATTRTFTYAIALHVGDQVLSDHGNTLTITGDHVYDQDLTAYNLQIDGIHTYYAGTSPVLVHNSCGWNAGTELPSGERAGAVGNRIWGRGVPSATRLDSLTPDELRALATREDALQLQAWYRDAATAGTGGKTAGVRVDLTQRIIDAWGSG